MSHETFDAEDQGGEEVEEEVEEEVVTISEEDLLKELDKQEPALQVCSRLFKSKSEWPTLRRILHKQAADLLHKGFFVMEDFFSLATATSLKAATEVLLHEGKLRSAKDLGTEQTSHHAGSRIGDLFFQNVALAPQGYWNTVTLIANPTARGDHIMWLHEGSPPASDEPFNHLLSMFRVLQEDLSHIMHLQRDQSEYQLGYYPAGGSQYVRHRDALPDDGSDGLNQRKLTAIAYANPGWSEEQGGKLRLWLPQSSKENGYSQEEGHPSAVLAYPGVVDIAPLAGRLVVFLSGAVDHAVLPAVSSRVALTCWLH